MLPQAARQQVEHSQGNGTRLAIMSPLASCLAWRKNIMSSLASVGASSVPISTLGSGAKSGAASKSGGALGASSSSSADVTTVVTNADGSVTTTVSDAKGNTISQSTAAASSTAATGATYARNAKAPAAANQAGVLSIGA
jgi:hypothetical protein